MDAFSAISDPKRRRILEMLSHRAMTAGEIGACFDVSAPAVSQHLKVLRDARLVTVRAQGQKRLYAIAPEGLESMEEWIMRMRAVWKSRLDALEAGLAGEEDES